MQDRQGQTILESLRPVRDSYDTTHTVGEHPFIDEDS